MLIANLDRSLTRRAPAEDAAEVLKEFPDGLTTAEVAQIMTEDKYAFDLDAAEDSLIAAVGEGERAARLPVRPRRALAARAAPVPRRLNDRKGRPCSGSAHAARGAKRSMPVSSNTRRTGVRTRPHREAHAVQLRLGLQPHRQARARDVHEPQLD